MPIKCVTLDLDDTLWDCPPLIHSAELAFLDWLSASYPDIAGHFDAAEIQAHRRSCYADFPHMQHDFTYLRKQWLSRLGREWGYGEQLVEPGFEVFITARNDVTLFDQVPGVLAELFAGYRVGAITNGNADPQRIGIGHWFHFVVSAALAGALKPHPRIFEVALKSTQSDAHEVVHVGDHPVNDVQGAASVGMRTVWINADGSAWPGGPGPDAEIQHVRELGAVLRAWDAEC